MNDKTEVPATFCLLVTFLLAVGVAHAQQSEEGRRSPQRTQQAQAVSKDVYDKIQHAEELIGAEEFDAALLLLERLSDSDKLTEYERSNVLQYIGVAQHNVGDTHAAIATFSEVLLIPSLEEQIRKQTVYTLAQLNSVAERYVDAIRYFEQWFRLESNPAPDPYVQYAQNLYQVQRYSEMIEPIETAIEVAIRRELPAKEEWYLLLNYAYFNQEDYRKVRDIHKVLLANWPKKQYWLSLAGAFTELGESDKLLAAYDAANTEGLLETEAELVIMAQLYMQHDVPFKAGMLLESEMRKGRVSNSAKNYRLLSQAWSLAHEDERSIPALNEAARLSDEGELDLRLGNAYLSLGRYAECVSAVRAGLQKGGVKSADNAHISLGMCLYHQRNYAEAINAFRAAGETPRSASIAEQWIDVIDSDIKRDEQIELAEAAAREKLRELAERRDSGDAM